MKKFFLLFALVPVVSFSQQCYKNNKNEIVVLNDDLTKIVVENKNNGFYSYLELHKEKYYTTNFYMFQFKEDDLYLYRNESIRIRRGIYKPYECTQKEKDLIKIVL